jgi:tetratricopeptide (TPR) repeat protein
MQREDIQAQAIRMAYIQADYLLGEREHVAPNILLSQAVRLVNDCIRHLNEPLLAIKVALNFHSKVQQWASWAGWDAALDLVLEVNRPSLTTEDQIRLLNHLSQTARELGDYAIATERATVALQLAQVENNPALIALTLNKLGMIELKRDNLVAAQSYLKDALKFGQDLLPNLELGHICLNLGVIAVSQGAFTDGYRYFEQALAYYEMEHDALHLTKVQCNIVDLQRRQGHFRAAPKTLLAALDVFEGMNARYECALTRNDLGCAYLSLRQFEPALAAFQAAVEEFEQLGDLGATARIRANIVELLVTAQRWDDATTAIGEARRLATICEKPLLLARIAVDEGQMLAALGKYQEARRAWEEALAIQTAKQVHLAAQYTQQLIDNLPE